MDTVSVPVVPTGGVPRSTAVPLPLSSSSSQAGGGSKKPHETGVIAPVEDNVTTLGTPLMKVAPDAHVPLKGQPEMLAVGADAMFILNCCRTVPWALDATMPQGIPCPVLKSNLRHRMSGEG